MIPELFNTDMSFYLIRFWGRKILTIFNILSQLNISLKYVTLNDFYISKDGSEVKLRCLYHYSFFNNDDRITAGPDIEIIKALYSTLEQPIGINGEQFNPSLRYLNDCFIAPEYLLTDQKQLTKSMDTWIFGCILFSLLFGKPPTSFISQLKDWCDGQTNLIFEKIVFPLNIINEHFFYYPYKGCFDEAASLKHLIESVRLKSYSAIVPRKYLNSDMESNVQINGLGLVLDMIASCMSVNPTERLDLVDLYYSDLFKFDNYETLLVNKFASNTLQFYSPEITVVQQMLLPLRNISAKIMQNYETINQFENFIFDVLIKIDYYFFPRKESTKIESDFNAREYDDGIEYVNNSRNMGLKDLNKKNSQVIKAIIDNKVIDIIIFLTLRHYSYNLKQYKKTIDKQLKEIYKVNDKKTEVDLKVQRSIYAKNEMQRYCGKLLGPLITVLFNCVYAMKNYDHMVSSYCENIIEYITRLFIGEDHIFLSEKIINKEESHNSKMKKYLHFRTFFRNEFLIKSSFVEDDADKIWSILNNNVPICEKETFWSPELYLMVHELYREALTESGNGNYKYPVIKNFFNVSKDKSLEINPFLNNDLGQYVNQKLSNIRTILTPVYINEILSLNECILNLNQDITSGENSEVRNVANKKSALVYISSVFKSKNVDRIRACFDFRIHAYIDKYLFGNHPLNIKIEALNIMKDISLGLVDMDEVSWLFGNNYGKVFDKTFKNVEVDFKDGAEDFNWDSNFSLINFLNTTLRTSHSYILQFADKFIGNKKSPGQRYVKEMAYVFSNPVYVIPLFRIVQKVTESMKTRQLCLDILFNIMISNNEILINTLNSPLCNFYEIIIKLINANPYEENTSNTVDYANFKKKLKDIIYILVEIQNPLIKSQMFKSIQMQKYLTENKMTFTERFELEEVYSEFQKMKDFLNYSSYIDTINKLINSYKCWIQHYYQGSGTVQAGPDEVTKMEETLDVIIHIWNIEWREGIKYLNKNGLIFNIVKLFEWLSKKKLNNLLFGSKNSLNLVIYLMTKIREVYNMIVIEDNVVMDSKVKAMKKKVDNDSSLNKLSSLNKIYHLIGIKLQNIISKGFNLGKYTEVFEKARFGILIGEVMKIQYNLLSEIFDKKKNDTNLLNNYIHENRLRLEFFDGILNSESQEIKLQFLSVR
jgi:hypothetical protein